MKFSEFKRAMLRHNELVLALKQNGAEKKEWREELENINNSLYEFYNQNPDALSVEMYFLAKRLKKLMEINPELDVVKMTFETVDVGRNRAFVADITYKDFNMLRSRSCQLGRIFDAETGYKKYAYLADSLNYESAFRDKWTSVTPGLEDALWQVAEENYNQRIEKQINLLIKTRKRIEENVTEIQKPDYIAKQLAELKAKDERAAEEIAALEAKLG